MGYVEILKKIPISGGFEEKHFGRTDPQSLWIKFHPTDSEPWVASIAGGRLESLKIYELIGTKQAAILTNGSFYLFDADSKQLLFNPDGYYTDFEVVKDNESNILVLATFHGIDIIKDLKIVAEVSFDFLADGIKFKSCVCETIIGDVYRVHPTDGNWKEFVLNVKTLALKVY